MSMIPKSDGRFSGRIMLQRNSSVIPNKVLGKIVRQRKI